MPRKGWRQPLEPRGQVIKACLMGNTLNSTAVVTNFLKLTFRSDLTVQGNAKALSSRCDAGHFSTPHLISSLQPLPTLSLPALTKAWPAPAWVLEYLRAQRMGSGTWTLMEGPIHMLEKNGQGGVLQSEQTG